MARGVLLPLQVPRTGQACHPGRSPRESGA